MKDNCSLIYLVFSLNVASKFNLFKYGSIFNIVITNFISSMLLIINVSTSRLLYFIAYSFSSSVALNTTLIVPEAIGLSCNKIFFSSNIHFNL